MLQHVGNCPFIIIIIIIKAHAIDALFHQLACNRKRHTKRISHADIIYLLWARAVISL